MKGNEKDCICAKENGKHAKYCDTFRLSEFMKRCAAVLSTETIERFKGGLKG